MNRKLAKLLIKQHIFLIKTVAQISSETSLEAGYVVPGVGNFTARKFLSLDRDLRCGALVTIASKVKNRYQLSRNQQNTYICK